jgi:hypothetical protein
MTLNDFHQSLTAPELPTGLSLALAGLWWDAKGDWTRAHESAQQDEGLEGSWVHAYRMDKNILLPQNDLPVSPEYDTAAHGV